MGLLGKLTVQVEIKSEGDLFHQLFKHTPHHVSGMSPDIIQGCDLHQGNWGTVGSIICWSYTHDGKQKIARDIIEAIDEEKRSITLKVIEGDILEFFKSFTLGIHVDTNGQTHLVTWVLEYEKLHEDVEDPVSLIPLYIKLTKDIEAHHLNNI
ncbi:kirola-like [Sesamum indicum]|uniref:Kirola-like n=1 Tax=Sesamum indicum TaxID=4182 RepID=A0A6I9U3E1_SESIN|nr:kirola-like [Sesamum indicum]